MLLQPRYVKINKKEVKQTRVVVSITLPLYSLRECAMQAIQRHVRDPDSFFALEIPSTLQKELHDMCNVRFCSRPNVRN